MPRWDGKNRPIGYILGLSPGFSQYGQGEEKLTNMGFARKIAKASRMGFEFAMIDFENIAEMFEPEIKKQVEIVKESQGMEIGLHLPVNLDLCLADAFQWMNMQRQLVLGAKTSAEILKTKFMLFHSSSNPRPNLIPMSGERQMPSKMASFNGMNFGDWIESASDDDFDLKQWFMSKFIKVMYSAMGVAPDVEVIKYFDNKENFQKEMNEINKTYEDAREKQKKDFRDTYTSIKEVDSQISEKKESDIEELKKLYKKKNDLEMRLNDIRDDSYVSKHFIEKYGKEEGREKFRIYASLTNRGIDMNDVFDYWKEHGSEVYEYVVYHTTAKWMWKKQDKLYKNVVDDNKDPDKIIKQANEKMGKKGKFDEKVKQIITAVAAKFIEGHLKAKGDYGIEVKDGNQKKTISVLDYAKNKHVHIFIETNMPPEGHAGELRIMKATDHIKIVKTIDPESLSYCMDLEHLTVNYIDPMDEAKEIRKKMNGDAKYIRCLHVNAPRPIPGAHAPVDLLSNDMAVLYKQIYELKKAGMNDSYIIWEMGSYGAKESAVAFRNIVKYLEKDTDPNNLPPEFFGIDENFEASQQNAIREHALDPLKGLLSVPEEDHTFLSKSAVEKNKAREWQSEELK